MGQWADTAQRVIAREHELMPAGVSLSERTKRIDAAYPFGERKYSPYKTWLRARKRYLAKYGKRPARQSETPLEACIRASEGE